MPDTTAAPTRLDAPARDPLRRWAVWLAWAAGLALVLAFEVPTQVKLAHEGPLWVAGQTLWLLLLGAVPLVMLGRRYVSSLGAAGAMVLRVPARALAHDAVYAVLVGAAAAGLSAWINAPTWSWPPAYHDEFSYLFQAKTLLAGRLYYPSAPMPDFFDTFHVLNEGVFASRYYPGNALWMLPGLALGWPHLMYVLAAGLIALLTFRIGIEAGYPLGARVASALVAVSPATQVFSTTLLSHPPCTVALLGFLLCVVRVFRTRRAWDALGAGAALGYAVLCRPPTALGVGAIPLLLLGAWLWRQPPADRRRVGLAVGIPLAVFAVLVLGYNAAITGDPLYSPHRLYNNTYTPRHRYGFYNVTRARLDESAVCVWPPWRSAFPERDAHPLWMHFERWADDLTPGLAVQKLVMRLRASTQWALATAAAPMLAVLVLIGPRRWTLARGCLVGGIVGMQAVYFPFAFEGIFSVSYALETVPLWCLLGGIAVDQLVSSWRRRGDIHMIVWVALVLVSAAAENWISVGQPVLSQIRTIRSRCLQLDRLLAAHGIVDHAIVFFHDDAREIHLNPVYNDPDLQGGVLRVWSLGVAADDALKARYPDRRCYFCRAVRQDGSPARWVVLRYPRLGRGKAVSYQLSAGPRYPTAGGQ